MQLQLQWGLHPQAAKSEEDPWLEMVWSTTHSNRLWWHLHRGKVWVYRTTQADDRRQWLHLHLCWGGSFNLHVSWWKWLPCFYNQEVELRYSVLNQEHYVLGHVIIPEVLKLPPTLAGTRRPDSGCLKTAVHLGTCLGFRPHRRRVPKLTRLGSNSSRVDMLTSETSTVLGRHLVGHRWTQWRWRGQMQCQLDCDIFIWIFWISLNFIIVSHFSSSTRQCAGDGYPRYNVYKVLCFIMP